MDSDGCINHWNETERKSPKKLGSSFPWNDWNECNKGSFNDNTGLSMSSTRVTMDSDGCINHWNETERKSPKKLGTSFPWNDWNECNKGSFNDNTGLSMSSTMEQE